MTTVQVASGGGEGRAVALAGKDPNQELPSSVAGDVCAQWAGAGAVGRALPTGQHWVPWASLGTRGNIRHHWALSGTTGIPGIPGNQRPFWTLLGITGHLKVLLNITGHNGASLGITGHHWASHY